MEAGASHPPPRAMGMAWLCVPRWPVRRRAPEAGGVERNRKWSIAGELHTQAAYIESLF